MIPLSQSTWTVSGVLSLGQSQLIYQTGPIASWRVCLLTAIELLRRKKLIRTLTLSK